MMQKIDREVLARKLRAEIALLERLRQGEQVCGLQLNRDGLTLEWVQSQLHFNQHQLESLESPANEQP